MADYSPTPRKPGRPRKEEVKDERRRRRGDTNALSGQKLAVDPQFKDPNYEYRWINDDGARIHDKTLQDDWDLVEDPSKKGKQDTDGLGSMVSKIVGKSEGGQPMHAYLARKRKDYYDEDMAAKRAQSLEIMDSIKRGVPQGQGADLGASAYVPSGGTAIKIEDDRTK